MQNRCSKNDEKSMPKWLPKSMNMAPKIDLEPTLGSNFSFWEAFGAMQKYHDLLMLFLRPKKWKKLAQGAFWEAPAVNGELLSGDLGPRAAPFRAREYLVPRYKGYKVQGTKVQGYKASSKRRQGYFKGSNTPKGQRPGEFLLFFSFLLPLPFFLGLGWALWRCAFRVNAHSI